LKIIIYLNNLSNVHTTGLHIPTPTTLEYGTAVFNADGKAPEWDHNIPSNIYTVK
jgi:hypothetical protein